MRRRPASNISVDLSREDEFSALWPKAVGQAVAEEQRSEPPAQRSRDKTNLFSQETYYFEGVNNEPPLLDRRQRATKTILADGCCFLR